MRRFFFAILICLLLCGTAAASQITELQTDLTVSADGNCQVDLQAVLALDEVTDTLLIPLGYGASDATIDGIAATLTKDKDGFCFVSLTGGFSGTKRIEVSYSIVPELSTTDEGLQMTLPLIPGRWSWPIASFSFTVTLPTAVENLAPTYESGYHQEEIADYLSLHQTETTFSGALSQELLDRETLTTTVLLPEDYFGTAVRLSQRGPLPVFRAIALLFWVLGLAYWFLTLRLRQLRVRRRAIPPDGSSAGLMPLLLFGAPVQAVGMLMQWCALGYLAIGLRKRSVTLYRQMDMGNERPVYERKFFAALFAGGTSCGGGRFVMMANELESKLQKRWSIRIFDPHGGNPLLSHVLMSLGCAAAAASSWHSALGGIIWTLAGSVLSFIAAMALPRGLRHAFRRQTGDAICWILIPSIALLAPVFLGGGILPALTLALQLVYSALVAWGPRRTRAGLELLAQARGLRDDFLLVGKKQLRARLQNDPQYFYTMLPYADAMGLGAAFAARFGSIILEPCGWMFGAKPTTASDFFQLYRRLSDILTGTP